MEASIQKLKVHLNQMFEKMDLEWELNEKMLLKTILGILKTEFSSRHKIDFYYTLSPQPLVEMALAQHATDPAEIADIKATNVGSATARYFATPTNTISKEKKLAQQLEYSTSTGADETLKRILSSANLPCELDNMEMIVNTAVFYNQKYPGVSAQPDGLGLIDGVVCPIELITTSTTLDMLSVCSSEAIRQLPKSKGYQKKLNLIHERAKARRQQKPKNQKGTDRDYDPNRRGKEKRKVTRKVISNKQLSEIPVQSRIRQIKEKISVAQTRRQFLEHLQFKARLPDEDRYKLYEKKAQLFTQMVCMDSPRGLLVLWKEGVVYYEILWLPLNAQSKVAACGRNFLSYLSS